MQTDFRTRLSAIQSRDADRSEIVDLAMEAIRELKAAEARIADLETETAELRRQRDYRAAVDKHTDEIRRLE